MRDKNSDKDGNGTRRKGQREVNWAEAIDNPGKVISITPEKSGGVMRGEDDYQGNWGVRLVMLDIMGGKLIPKLI